MSGDVHGPVAQGEPPGSEQASLAQTSAPLGELGEPNADATRARTRLRALAALAAVLIAAVAVVVATNPFAGSGTPSGGVSDNGTSTSSVTVTRQSLSSQTQVNATLGYAGSANILVPSGSAPSAVLQARQTLTSAEATLTEANSSLASDANALATLRSSIAAAKAKAAVDCAGDGAIASAASNSGEKSPAGESSPSGEKSPGSEKSPSDESSPGSEKTPDGETGSGSTPCSSDQQSLATDEASLPQDSAKVEGDRTSLASAQSSLANARSSYAQERSTATSYAQGAVYTALPAVGQIVERNHDLFSIAGQPAVLLYGTTVATRAFIAGMSRGRDVAELNSNLEALAYGHELGGDAFTSATAAAIRAFQSAHGMSPTGELLLGSVIFERDAVRVTAVTPTVGSTANPGPALAISSTTREVTIQLEATEQSNVKVGDPVTITLPSRQTTPGVVKSVGTVAKTPSGKSGEGKGGEEETPTVEVTVRPTDPSATGHLDQAPVTVAITSETVKDVLAVPVTALLALASGGYAVEEVAANGVHRLVAVTTGLFDDASGLVQVSGSELAAGQRVVVPKTS
jgi:peptidoglycan hydrolase-like protein with peptidoglycan-binding domain